MVAPAESCPCGTALTYAACCAPLHRGEAAAATAEQLMRSRYSAFAAGDAAYLLRTWHASTRPRRLRLDPRERWLGLEVLGRTAGGLFDAEGTVEFRAHAASGLVHEDSRFVRDDGWQYVGPQR